MLLPLLACALYPEPVEVPTWPRVGDRLEVEVTARMQGAEAPVAWTARARVGPPRDDRAAGCRRVAAEETPDPEVERIAIDVPAPVDLAWQSGAGRWAAEGPRAAVDPAWAVGTVLWVKEGVPAVAAGAIRFAGAPDLGGVARDEDGSVWLWWPKGDGRVVVRANAGGVPYDCVGDATGVRVPWWLLPAQGGEVVVRTERDRVTIVPDKGVVHVRAVIEEVVPLDVPFTTRGEPPPGRVTPRERPKRLYRSVPWMG